VQAGVCGESWNEAGLVALSDSKARERIGQRRARKVAAIIVMLMGLILFLDRVELVRHGMDSADWPVVTGEVVESEARPIGDVRSGGTWSLTVRYVYQVDGRQYSGDRMRFARSIVQRERVQIDEALEQYEPGNPILVHHHPQHHELSVLETGLDRSGWLGMLLAILLMIVAVVFWVVPTRTVSSASG
jgi:hypothetical protein